MDEQYMELAYQQALHAYENDEVPIGAIIVKDSQVIASAFNQKETLQDVTAHAEILAIQQACQYLSSWHLDDCTLYVTLEPCLMCSGAIIQSRIKRVVYGASTHRWSGLNDYLTHYSFNHKPLLENGILEEKCSILLFSYFKNKRLMNKK